MGPTTCIPEQLAFLAKPDTVYLGYLLNPLRAHFGKWHKCPYYCNKHDDPSSYSLYRMKKTSDQRRATHLFYDSIFPPIWFFFLLPKLKVFKALSSVLFHSPKTSSAQIFQSPQAFQKPSKYVFSSDFLFQLNPTILFTGHLNVNFQHKVLLANNLIILILKISHCTTFPLLTS